MTSKTPYEQAREMSTERASTRSLRLALWDVKGWIVTGVCVLLFGFLLVLPTVKERYGLPKLNALEASRSGTKQEMLTLIKGCPKARRAMGKDIRFSYGSESADYAFDSAHRNGTARFDVPVTGSRASARLKYAWVTQDRVNTVKRAMLVLDDDKINLKKCGGKKKAAHKAKRAKRRMKANRRFRTKFSKRKKRR